jgi:hypothetical protein
MKFWLKIKTLYRTLIASHATPREVSLGFALGVFIGFTPTLGLQTFIAIGLAALFKMNKISALIGVFITNPVTALPIYGFILWLGRKVLHPYYQNSPPIQSINDLVNAGANVFIPLWVGGLIAGIIAALISYYICLYIYPFLKKKSAEIKEKIHH